MNIYWAWAMGMLVLQLFHIFLRPLLLVQYVQYLFGTVSSYVCLLALAPNPANAGLGSSRHDC